MKSKLLYRILLHFICCVFYIQANAQLPVGTTFTSGLFTYEITVAGTANANSVREVAVTGYLDVNNLTPTIPSTTFFSTTYNVTSIGFGAFNTKSLTGVTIPSSIISIGEHAFSNNSLTTITIPSSVTSIGENAFNTNLLTSVTIPSSVTSIGANAFASNSTLIAVVSESINPATLFASTFDDNSLIDLTVPVGLEQDYIDTGWVGFKSINSVNYTIAQNDILYQILDITNNDEVAAVDYLGASNTAIAIPAIVNDSGFNYNVTTVGASSFANNSLTSVTIPSSVINIGASAFANNSLTNVTIPSLVTSIGASAFQNNFNLVTVTSESTSPATLLSFTFFNNNSGIDLIIPAGTSSVYASARWINFNSITETACFVNIPDPIFKQILLGRYPIDTNNNNEIECDEAGNYTGDITLVADGVTDYTGLEAFTALRMLSIDVDPITTIDLSNNTALETLRLVDTQISTIDLSANINLKKIEISTPNLSVFDVSSNTALEEITVIGTQITDMDFSNNMLLTDVRVSDNNLTKVNMANGNNTAVTRFDGALNPLSCVQIDSGFTPNNNWLGVSPSVYRDNCFSLSINDFNFEAVSLYPNPSALVLNIEMNSLLKQATIYSVLGAKVLTTTSNTINTSSLESGLYLIKIENTTGAITTKRFIKK